MRIKSTKALILFCLACFGCDDDDSSPTPSETDTSVVEDAVVKEDAVIGKLDGDVDDAEIDGDVEDAEVDGGNNDSGLCADGPNDEIELCNGIDDNCDGETDEGFNVGEPCEALGICAAVEGVYECDDEGGVRCSTAPGGSQSPALPAELCNGLDDNCNGLIDEDVASVPCYTGPEDTNGVGICHSGTTACQEGQTVCIGEQLPETELCNGKDDDCNGETDENLADVVELCNGKDDNCNGETDEGFDVGESCEALGICAAIEGVYECDDEGGMRCSTEPGGSASIAQEETCNGKDDDCDGETDEGFDVGTICPALGRCGAGIIECNYEGNAVCNTGPGGSASQAREETCNSIDDDCDGETDEGIEPQPCYNGPANTEGVGICHGGNKACQDGSFSGLCEGEQTPQTEICNGLDDDCDGETDEGLDVTETTTCGLGVCVASGTRVCENGSYTVTCTPGQPNSDVDDNCDGIDDDCDGDPDDDFVGEATSCGVGACAATGRIECINGRLVDTCTPGLPANYDTTCDGIDDDCDGVPDDDFVGEQCGVGVCKDKSTPSDCVNGVLIPCVEGTPDVTNESDNPEFVCNGKDDNCDGNVDEDFVPVQGCGIGACYNDEWTQCLSNPLTHTSDIVQCEERPNQGIKITCQEGDSNCVGLPEGVDYYYVEDETDCNGIDDDCDGETDEHYVPRETSCGLGVCYRTFSTSCTDGVESDEDNCEPGQPNVDPALNQDNTCNGIDDDCDGETDEDVTQYSSTDGQLNREKRLTNTTSIAGFCNEATASSASDQPRMADNGTGFKMVWAENYKCTQGNGAESVTTYHENSGIYIADLSYDGTISGRTSITTTATPFIFPDIVYTGSGYGLVWVQTDTPLENGEPLRQVHFARLDQNGALIANSEKQLTSTQTNKTLPHIVWNAESATYGLIWTDEQDANLSNDNSIQFTQLSPEGNVVSAERALIHNNAKSLQSPQIIALNASNKFAIIYAATTEKSVTHTEGAHTETVQASVFDLFFRTIGATVNDDSAPVNVTNTDYTSNNPAICATENGFAIAYTDQTNGQDEMFFALLNQSGAIQGNPVRINTNEFMPMKQASAPSLVHTDDGFGLSWIDTTYSNSGLRSVRFQHLTEAGGLYGSPIMISFDDSRYAAPISDSWYPHLVWHKVENAAGQFAFVWQDNRDNHDEIYFSVGPMGCTPSSQSAENVAE